MNNVSEKIFNQLLLKIIFTLLTVCSVPNSYAEMCPGWTESALELQRDLDLAAGRFKTDTGSSSWILQFHFIGVYQVSMEGVTTMNNFLRSINNNIYTANWYRLNEHPDSRIAMSTNYADDYSTHPYVRHIAYVYILWQRDPCSIFPLPQPLDSDGDSIPDSIDNNSADSDLGKPPCH